MKNVTLLIKAIRNNCNNWYLKKPNPTQTFNFWPITSIGWPQWPQIINPLIFGFLYFRSRIWLSILHLSSQPRSYSTQSKSSKSGISKSGVPKSDTTSTFTCNSSCPAFSTATASQTQPFPWQPFGLAQISICRI